MDKSIVEMLPEDILAIILSEYGLHASLGSTCRVMRILSLSEKCIGSVCITINDNNKNADREFLLYKHTYSLVVTRALTDDERCKYYFIGDYVWPYLTRFESKSEFFLCGQGSISTFLTIYAPRLTDINTPLNVCMGASIFIKCVQQLKKRMPMLVSKITYLLIDLDKDFRLIVSESKKGLKINECFLCINTPTLEKSNMQNIIRTQTDLVKFITTLTVTSAYMVDIIDREFIECLSKIALKRIRIMNAIISPISIDHIDLVINQLNTLYDICYNHPNTNDMKERISIEYLVRCNVKVDYNELYTHLLKIHSEITLTKIEEASDNCYNSYCIVFKYPCT